MTTDRNDRRRPSLVLIFADQQHWQACGHTDPFFETPCLDQLAGESVVFDHCFCTTAQCSPSRSSIFTGQYPHRTGVWNNVGASGGSELQQATVGAALQDAGYHTGYFGKWHLGDDPIANRGWDNRVITTDDAQSSAAACQFVESAAHRDQPFALVVSLNDPHDVYHFQREAGELDVSDVPLPESWEHETFEGKPAVQRQFMTADQGRAIDGQPREDWQRYRAWYREVTRRYDQHLGEVVDALRAAGTLDESVLIVTSDHGDMDTQHRLIYKGPFMYEHMVRVPLLVRLPARLGGGAAHRRSEHVVLTDLTPTLRDFADLPAVECDGQSLRPLVQPDCENNWHARPFVIGQYHGKQRWENPMRMIRTSQFKYILPRRGKAELYDLTSDPHELSNLADSPAHADTVATMRAQLEQWMQANADPFWSLQATDRQGQAIAG